jgi:hypothetical protein
MLRIRLEGQNVISVALFKPAVLAATHCFQEKNKVGSSLPSNPLSDRGIFRDPIANREYPKK